MRLIMALASGSLKIRGLSLPGCGRGVTVPTSTKPKPKASNALIHSPFLSNPAANPTGFGNLMPITSTGLWGIVCL